MFRRLAPAAAFLSHLVFSPAASSQETVDFNAVAKAVSSVMENQHFSKAKLNAALSQEFLNHYLNLLDSQRLYFTQADIQEITIRFGESLHRRLRNGSSLPAAEEIWTRYETRVAERTSFITQLAEEEEFLFQEDRTIRINRETAPWPKDQADAERLWRDVIGEELLREILSKQNAASRAEEAETFDAAAVEDEARKNIVKRYQRILENIQETDREEMMNYFLSSLAQTFDPHSDYFSHSETVRFSDNMNNSLIGIGALLQEHEDGSTQIKGIVIKGPADRQGELQIDDRITGVDPTNNGNMIDTVHMKLDKVVDLIRGKKGSKVRLRIIPAEDASLVKEIVIAREEVELKDRLASAELFEYTPVTETQPSRIGWINIPSFYANMDGDRDEGISRDVRSLLDRLVAEKVDGVVLDLRGNGGGALDEAVKLTGLFIPRGPVVQSLDSFGNREPYVSYTRYPLYDGPLVVLVDKTSASASEILAAALQDYGRAVIVGSASTFGKGTIQKVRPVSTEMPMLPFFSDRSKAGALKLTEGKFYRIAGGSTQLKGVIPDIVVPNLLDALEIGEDALDGALPHTDTRPLPYETWPDSLFLEELEIRHQDRIEDKQEFAYIKEDVNRIRQQRERNQLSLNLEKRLAEAEENEARKKERNEERRLRFELQRQQDREQFSIYHLTLDDIKAKAQLEKIGRLSDDADDHMRRADEEEEETVADGSEILYPSGIDPLQRETIQIMSDLIKLQRQERLAQVERR